jgi:phosphatidylglycerol---prolipoprotein diacylglyceryl transferase
MLTTLAYYLHDLNPIIFELGPIKPRWYGLSYLMGFLGAYILIRKLARDGMLRLAPDKVADMVLNSCIFGVLIGGRLGYVLFYDLPNALKEHATPLLWQFTDAFPYWGALRVMDGGMSAHGGILFSILTLAWFAHRYKASLVNILDAAAMVVPIGLCFGRIANFINGELWGRSTDVAWAMVFPRGGPLPRHPSQLYQAFFEGVVLLSVIVLVWRLTDGRRRPGLLTGVFCVGYGVARIVGEVFREPDAFLGYIWGPLTMGMLLSVPLLVFGGWLIARAYRAPPLALDADASPP